jgi:integral membrane sensor domain MASE1
VTPEFVYARAAVYWLRHRLANQDPEAGQVPEWVIIIAFGAVIAAAVGAIYLAKFKSKATSLNLNTP